MGLFSTLFKPPEPGLSPADLAARLNLPLSDIQNTPIAYRELRLPKRTGDFRILHAPDEPLKRLQRTLLRRLLSRLSAHPAAMGFEPGLSIVSNARPHVGAAVLLKMDLRNFFTTTTAARVRDYFINIGWGGHAADLLVSLTTHRKGLPQGAPTSPRLSNLLNYPLDARLFAFALTQNATYTRYADDLTFSFPKDHRPAIAQTIQMTQLVVASYGYHLHTSKKLKILRQHDRMLVTGLVVNSSLNLPRSTRRRLRAIHHHLATNRPATLTPAQLQGWQALASMLSPHLPPSPAPPP